MSLIGSQVVIQTVQPPPYRYFWRLYRSRIAYVLIVQTVRRRISTLSALTFCVRLPKKQDSERFHVRAILELPTVLASSTALCQQADLDFCVNSEG
jgi:hypothetical protein